MKYDVEFVLNSDAHSITELSLLQFSVDQARRANLPRSRIFNTRQWSSMRKANGTRVLQIYQVHHNVG